MNAVWAQLPALQVVIPLVGAILVGFLRRGTAGFALALVVSVSLPFISGALLWQVLTVGPVSYALGGWAPPFGIEYRIDLLNGFVLTLVSTVGAVIMPFAYRSVREEVEGPQQAWFYCVHLLCLTGLLGVTITGDAFNAFVFLEISSLATYVLIALGRDRRALTASFQYLILGTVGATFYVIGIGFLYVLTGSLNMGDIADRLAVLPPDQTRAVVAGLAFLTVGLSVKVALFPMHAWLPNAYAFAPSWVTAFLAATATKVSIYLLVRFYFTVLGPAIDIHALPVSEILIALSLAAMFAASFAAVFERNVKRMLAYSSVAQIGYITLGIGLANQAGLTGALAHIINHSLMKAALFLALGAIVYRIGSVQLRDLAGLGRRMPFTMAAFTISGLGLVGTPGTSGFISKWYLAVGALDRGWWVLVLLLVGSSMLAFVYVGRVVEVAYMRSPEPRAANATDPPLSLLLPILALALATLFLGFDTHLSVGIADAVAKTLLVGLRQ